ncbi:MAG: Xaa-Pro peptidase family protein [Thermoleophilia bacterium]
MPILPAEIERRIVSFQKALRAADIECALLIEASDLIYSTGVMADAHLLVPAADDPILLVRRSLERVQAESPIEDVRPFRSFKDLPPLIAELGARRIGLELDVLPAARYLRYRDLLPEAELVDVSEVLAGVRAVKSTWELKMIGKAAEQVAAAFAAAPAAVAELPTDLAIHIELEHLMRQAGHQGPLRFRGLNGQMFYGAVLAGPDGAVAPWADTPLGGPGPSAAVGKGPGGWEIRDGDSVTVDLVGGWEGYLADATRTFFRGTPNPQLAEALAVCESILTSLEELMRPGVPAEDLYLRGLELATDAGFGDHWMGHGPGRVRFVGHGVGLEINERPFLAQGFSAPLEFGNVIAVEPKLVFPGLGAVGIENTYVVDRDGPVQLT